MSPAFAASLLTFDPQLSADLVGIARHEGASVLALCRLVEARLARAGRLAGSAQIQAEAMTAALRRLVVAYGALA